MTDKRLLKQQYLETKTRAGVYMIRNRVTGRVLVAGAGDAQGALNRHRFELRQGSHRNRLLRQDWLSHGETSFTFEVLDMVKPGADTAADITRELADLLVLWRQEIPCHGALDYEPDRSAP
ncbi:hypothetical protein IP91_01103 [Pseudoduganella lurida]|uniref:GIY-YIG nuclease family protein n=1 Tax=Pseudoduganella lurida TaxID=1036180 RepID=A0A562RLV0_9BURK|nr:GIY-YIG nuclease family protein [Pseudoduganella lurida]TWI70025.1 hypothetical protein IP91_01103 [Pseudoduganella lurida]